MPELLDRDEYVEQAYLFRELRVRMQAHLATQDLLRSVREELLSTTRLPLAVDFLCSELKLHGLMAPAMQRIGHYFTPFQAYVMGESERDRGRFDFRLALEILQREAEYKAQGASPQGAFFYQFESISRNRLGYEHGLSAMAQDPIYSADWSTWILKLRRQLGMVDLTELVYVRSGYYVQQRTRLGLSLEEGCLPTLFGEKEGQIALAHRRKDPLYFFASLQRHLLFPLPPRPPKPAADEPQLPALSRRVERLEARLKLLEDEARGGLDLTQFYGEMPPPGEAED